MKVRVIYEIIKATGKSFTVFIKKDWKFLVVVIFLIFATYEIIQMDKTIRSINRAVSSIESEVSSIESEVSSIQSDVSSIQLDVSFMQR
jgi:peptidoglycan hydrolase CwlO-like protein